MPAKKSKKKAGFVKKLKRMLTPAKPVKNPNESYYFTNYPFF